MYKPFRPPLQARLAQPLRVQDEVAERPTKRPRTTELPESSVSQQDTVQQEPPVYDVSSPTSVRLPSSQTEQQTTTGNIAPITYIVVWRKFTTKKNKTWDGDGRLVVRNGIGTLLNDDGTEIGRTRCAGPLLPDSIVSMSGKEVQVESLLPVEHRSPASNVSSKRYRSSLAVNLKPMQPLRVPLNVIRADDVKGTLPTQIIHKSYKNPFLGPLPTTPQSSEVAVPRHPVLEDSLVMKRPLSAPRGKQIVDVVVDPVLSKALREHQRDGVKFLYECVMGMRRSGDGAILADEMGLGKTLQVITLLWTLMKQNPVYGDQPLVKKALIVCPVTLIKNWRKEFRKWLGFERIGVFILDDKDSRITDFTKGKSYNVMIIGYEKLRTVAADIQAGAPIDIVIADEGHRLKTAQNKSALAIKSLSTTRRVILSGTPLQNDLSEFYFMVDFVNPGLLGKFNTFKREFEQPIVRSRQPEATDEDKEKGKARSEELSDLTSLFIVRRTADILSKYLPPKSEYVVFCRPSSSQAEVYRKVVGSTIFQSVINGGEGVQLQLISILKKLCNSPVLLLKDSEPGSENLVSAIRSELPKYALKSPGASGKLQVLDNLLYQIRSTTKEKVVIVSHYTATLDLIAQLLNSLDYKFLRLDGNTGQAKRQEYVDKFNRTDASTIFAFLLSAKSGGVGLNLIGASRLILFDNDWNPSNDLQAMARIHRDGQKLPCNIYRLITQGALDEKIFQRQATKLSLADSIVDNKTSLSSFTRAELRDLFRLHEGTDCQTHKLIACPCQGYGFADKEPEQDVVDEDVDEPLPIQDEAMLTDEAVEISSTVLLEQLPNQFNPSQLQSLQARAAEEDRMERVRSASNDKAGKMSALMQYRHVDCSKKEPSHDNRIPRSDMLESAIADEVLLRVINDADSQIGYVFTKTSS